MIVFDPNISSTFGGPIAFLITFATILISAIFVSSFFIIQGVRYSVEYNKLISKYGIRVLTFYSISIAFFLVGFFSLVRFQTGLSYLNPANFFFGRTSLMIALIFLVSGSILLYLILQRVYQTDKISQPSKFSKMIIVSSSFLLITVLVETILRRTYTSYYLTENCYVPRLWSCLLYLPDKIAWLAKTNIILIGVFLLLFILSFFYIIRKLNPIVDQLDETVVFQDTEEERKTTIFREATNRCPSCGHTIIQTEEICDYCGERIN
jgi:hypothetical protein